MLFGEIHRQASKPTALITNRLMGGVVILRPTAELAVRVAVPLLARARLLLLSAQLLQGVMGDVEAHLMGLHAIPPDLLADAAQLMGMTSILIKTQSLENDADQLSDTAATHQDSKNSTDDFNDHFANQTFLQLSNQQRVPKWMHGIIT